MRAKLITEASNDVLKGKSGKDIINSRVNTINEIQKKINNSLELIKYVSSDYQLEEGHPDYMGFLNVGVDMFYDKKLQTALKDFVYLYNNGYSKFLNKILSKVRLELQGGVDEDEVVFGNI
jgi:hypothetical protein